MPNSESVHALSGAYAVDALEDDERAAFERHLERCEDCRHEIASLREAAALMSLDARVAPPPGLRDRLLSDIAQVRPLPPVTERPESPAPAAGGATVLPFRRRIGQRARVAVAAAAVVVVGIGLGVSQPWAPDDDPPVAAERVLASTDAQAVTQRFPDGSSATVTRSPSQGLAVIQTSDMADPPAQRVFELWLLDAEGAAVPAGVMSSGGDKTVVLDGDAAEAAAVAITEEPQGGSQQPTSDPIAMFDLEDV
ncbi:anti-sigma factor [Nocardioides marmoraquaticus]